MLVTDRAVAGGMDSLPRKVAEAVSGGVNIVQLRDKDLPHRETVDLITELRHAISGRAVLVANRPAQTVLSLHADGVHLPEDAEAPEEWPHRLLIGRSVHSAPSARRAEADGADYVVFGPVYETATHAGAPPLGCAALRQACQVVSVPVIAIGGVTIASVPEVMAAGAAGIAVVRAILAAPDPKAAAESLHNALTESRLVT
jgi:thiamine-phosphate pyrophosphorylase